MENKVEMKILIACEFSGIVREAFAKKGHDAWSCDLLPTEIPGQHFQCDVTDIIYKEWDMIIAHPPCTDLASSGARWFADKRKNGSQDKSISFFMLFVNLACKHVAIENPIGIMSSVYKKPEQIIHPYHFGTPETKGTCLWLKGLPLLKHTDVVEPDFMRKPNGDYYRDAKGKRYSRIHFLSGRNKDRSKIRSITYQGIANAMADQWG